jgi:hypothetical protein
MCWDTEYMALWRPRFPFSSSFSLLVSLSAPYLTSVWRSTFTIEVYAISGGAPKWTKKYGNRYAPGPSLFMDPSSVHIEGGKAPPVPLLLKCP